MRKITSVILVILTVLLLSSCGGKKTAKTTSSMPVVVLPEGSNNSITVNSESDNASQAEIRFVGNKNSRVYHKENCNSVKNMNEKNKVFFSNEKEATDANYKPCGNCMN